MKGVGVGIVKQGERLEIFSKLVKNEGSAEIIGGCQISTTQ